MACVNDVTDSLKSCSKIYYLKRGENEVRVNDYNPLLLMLWRANMDLQYISETSLNMSVDTLQKQRKVTYRIYGIT